jgi:hypothetical protein
MKIFSEFDESQCLWLLDFSLDDRSSVLINLQENFLLSNPSFMVVTPCLNCIAYQWFFVRRIICRNLKLIDHLSLASSQRMLAGMSVLHSNRIRNVSYRNTEKKWPAAFQAKILEDWSSIRTVISFLKLPENFIYLKFCTSKKYKYCIRAHLCVSYDFQNKKNFLPFHCASYLTQSFLFQIMHNIHSFKHETF